VKAVIKTLNNLSAIFTIGKIENENHVRKDKPTGPKT
jgi:hypothetical protein